MNAFLTVDEKNMSRRTYDSNRNAGDTTEQTFYSEWMLVNGSAVGQHGTPGSRSELFSAYSTTLDADRSALPVTDHALMLAQTDLEYEVTRVKSPVLGRDLNPMGRGDGAYYANGGNLAVGASVAVFRAKPGFVGNVASGYGSSVNNDGPPAECTAACICRVDCLEGWYQGTQSGWPTRCCGLGFERERYLAAFCCYPKYTAAVMAGGGNYQNPMPPDPAAKEIGDAWIKKCLCPGLEDGGRGPERPEKPWDCDYIKRSCDRIGGYTLGQYVDCYNELWDQSHYGKMHLIAFLKACNDARRSAQKKWDAQGCRALMSVGAQVVSAPRPPKCQGFPAWCINIARDYCYGRELCKHYHECCR